MQLYAKCTVVSKLAMKTSMVAVGPSRRPHAKLVARNRAVLANLQATCSTRAFRTVPPQELTDAAHKAARLIDTDAHIQTASRSYTRALWYQSRVWDPDD